MVVADGANFEARQNHADFELFAEVVVEGGAAVDSNHRWNFGFFHGIIIA